MKSNELKKLLKIAQKEITTMENRKDLKQHYSDEEDFLDIAVWELEAALKAAYELGKKSK